MTNQHNSVNQYQAKTNRLFGSHIQRRFTQKLSLLLIAIGLLFWVTSCQSNEESVAPVNTGESISYKIDGKEYSDNTLTSPTASTDDFGLWSFIVLSNNLGYDLKLYVSSPKVGTFTSQSKKLTGEFGYIKSLTDFQSFAMTNGTVTFTAYDKNGFAEGTFSLTAKSTTGQTVSITDGKFRMDLR